MEKTNKILILDDEVLVTASLKALFEIEGYTDIFDFNSPLDALTFLESNTPDVIISDFIMPDMNGLQFLKEAKRYCPDVSLLLLTGYADKENAIRAINEVGLYKYIEKPWNNDDLILNIKNAIERTNLILELKDKVVKLKCANDQLKVYNESLEGLVSVRTSELRKSNDKLNAIINNCADGIVIFNSKGQVISANPACEDLFGLSEQLLISKTITELFFTSNLTLLQGIFSNFDDKFIRDISLQNFVNGSLLPVEISFACVHSDEHDEKLFVSVIRDVSVQKEMERLRDDFIATLTHDLRTPLLAAIQTLQFFLDGSLGDLQDKQQLLLQTMRKSNQDMLGLVNALLEVYKYESGKLQLLKSIFNINEMIQHCTNEISSLAHSKNIAVSLEIDSTLDIDIYADKNEIRRVLMNFIGNAINYTNADGKVSIKTQLQDKDLIVSVRDNGIGIDKSDIPKLFNRFSQGTSQRRSASTGLGLYLSKQIIEAHGGKVWLESDRGKGSEFSFVLLDVAVVKDRV